MALLNRKISGMKHFHGPIPFFGGRNNPTPSLFMDVSPSICLLFTFGLVVVPFLCCFCNGCLSSLLHPVTGVICPSSVHSLWFQCYELFMLASYTYLIKQEVYFDSSSIPSACKARQSRSQSTCRTPRYYDIPGLNGS